MTEAPRDEQDLTDSRTDYGSAHEGVLLVEDDVGDATIVRELLADADPDLDLRTVASLAAAETALDASIACVLFDLGLPDAEGLEGLTTMIKLAPHAAVVVLTGLSDRRKGALAVGLGAEDYLVKGAIDGDGLAKSIRYAIARRRGEDVSRRLAEAEFLRSENARLERGLLPRPLLKNPRLRWATRYQPGGRRALLGGDFFDAVELDDGTVRVIVGDVSGHGPDEAALGVALRVAWRALVLANVEPGAVIPALERVLVGERAADHIFVTLSDLVIGAQLDTAQLRLAGHPAPLCLGVDEVSEVPVEVHGPVLGVVEGATWPAVPIELGPTWTLLLYTDGIVEGRAGDAGERLDTDGLAAIAGRLQAEAGDLESLADRIVAEAEEANGEPLRDDVAVFLLSTEARWSR